jgi:hypothetical protein
MIAAIGALLERKANGEALALLADAIAKKPFDGELRKLQISTLLEDGQRQEAAAAINDKAKLCGLKAHDGNSIIALYLQIREHHCHGPVFDALLAHPFVGETIADVFVESCTDGERVHIAAIKLIRYGVFDAGRTMLQAALEHHLENAALHRLLIQCCSAMHAYEDAAAAVNRKNAACGLDGADRDLLTKLHSTIIDERLRGPQVDTFMSLPHVQDIVADNARFCIFESLGNDCELGNVQRNLGQEPLGLLRFSSIPLPTLIKLLKNNFRDFALPENCDLTIVDMGDQAQYDLVDHFYKYQVHTFIVVDKITSHGAVLEKFCARVQFLKRKLLEDLAEGKKIFVYKAHFLPDRDIAELARALRRHGKCRLLAIQEFERKRKRQSTSIEHWDALTVRGYIENFNVRADSPSHVKEWKALLDAALETFSKMPNVSHNTGFFTSAVRRLTAQWQRRETPKAAGETR